MCARVCARSVQERKRVIFTPLVLHYKAIHNILLFEENHDNVISRNSAKKKKKIFKEDTLKLKVMLC